MRLRDIILSLFLAAVCVACTSDVLQPSEGQGKLRLSLVDISTAVTRSTPADLGVPSAEDFTVVLTNAVGNSVYEGLYSTDDIELPTGDYTVTASYGENASLAIDKPYYVASKTVTIKAGEITNVTLNAKVGNALVSAIFGKDDAERQRFDRFYSDYALYVAVGSYSIPITKEEPAKSIYVRAGTDFTLRFWGKLKFENDREVSQDLTIDINGNSIAKSLNAADHAKVTLTLPDPESAMTVAISKVEVQELTLDETIPLSWLPVAMVVPMHQYDDDGTLLGTNILVTESFPGLKWRAVIENAAGTVVRAIEGKGPLQSYFFNNNKSDQWPYLPQGNYIAKFYFSEDDEHFTLASTRDFTIEAPTIHVTATGYTSYSKYLEGDIAAANACDRLTVYEPSVSLSVAPDLLRNSNYSYSFTYTYDGETKAVTTGTNNYTLDNFENQAVQVAPHVLRADASFDGVSVSAKRELRITGLPANFAPPSESNGWSKTTGTVNFESSYVQLGKASWTNPHAMQNATWVNIPKDTYICLNYNIELNQSTVNTTFTATAGGQILIQSESENLKGTSQAIQTTSNITVLDCESSWGSGATTAKVYQLNYLYANKP